MTRNSFRLGRGAVCFGICGLAVLQSADSRAFAQPLSPEVQAAQPQAVPAEKATTTSTAQPMPAEPGYLGVIADDADTEGRGVRLISVLQGGPAGQADLRVGDLVTSINGQAVVTTAQLAEIMQPFKANDEVTFVVRRGNEVQRLDIRLGQRPGPDQRALPTFGRQPAPMGLAVPTQASPTPTPAGGNLALPQMQAVETLPAPKSAPTLARVVPGTPTPAVAPPSKPVTNDVQPPAATASADSPPRSGSLLGVRAVPLTREMQEALNLPEPKGALVIEVREGSAAQRAGLPVEAVIVGVDGKTIYSPADLADVLAARGAGAEVRLAYFRYGQLTEKNVRLGTPEVAVTSSKIPEMTLPDFPKSELPKLPPEDETTALRRRVRELESRLKELEAQLKTKQP